MKIAFLIPTLTSGGAERVLTHMANYWASKGNKVTIITLDDPTQPSFYPLAPQIQLIQLNLIKEEEKIFKKIIRTYSQAITLKKQIDAVRPHVLISFLDIAIFLSLALSFFVRPKVIISERTNPYLSSTNKVIKFLNRKLYRYADQIVLQTDQIAATFPAKLKKSITVISNPVVLPEMQIEDYNRLFHNKTIITVGRLNALKGHDILIQAFAQVSKLYPDWSLVIIGEGESRIQLEALCSKNNISDKVHLVGRISNPGKILLKSSIFVLSSYYEGFPNALCEAMALGLPVVSTRCPFGPEEIIQDQVNGLLVPVGDPDTLSQTIIKLIESPDLCKSLGENARQITQRLNINKIMYQWEDVLDRLVQEK